MTLNVYHEVSFVLTILRVRKLIKHMQNHLSIEFIKLREK